MFSSHYIAVDYCLFLADESDAAKQVESRHNKLITVQVAKTDDQLEGRPLNECVSPIATQVTADVCIYTGLRVFVCS